MGGRLAMFGSGVAMVVAMVVVLPSPSAMAQPKTKVSKQDRARAQKHYKRGFDFFQKGDYDRAIAAMVIAIGYVREAVFLRNISRAYEKKGDFGNAARYLREAVALTRTPNDIFELKRRIAELDRLESERLAKGAVIFEVNVDGAVILVDGKEIGRAPLKTVELSVGVHQVEVRADQFKTAKEKITVESAAEQTVKIRLMPKPKMGTLVIIVSEVDAEVRLDGKDVGLGPLRKELQVVVGEHEVVVEKDKRLPFTQSVEVKKGKSTTLQVEMKNIPKKVVSKARTTWGWGLLSGGLALVGTGVLFTVLAHNERDLLNGVTTDTYTGSVVSMNQLAASEAESNGNRNETVSVALYGAGGAAFLTGVTLLIIGNPPAETITENTDTPAVRWGLSPTAGTVELTF